MHFEISLRNENAPDNGVSKLLNKEKSFNFGFEKAKFLKMALTLCNCSLVVVVFVIAKGDMS
jgi:hypothetical protein